MRISCYKYYHQRRRYNIIVQYNTTSTLYIISNQTRDIIKPHRVHRKRQNMYSSSGKKREERVDECGTRQKQKKRSKTFHKTFQTKSSRHDNLSLSTSECNYMTLSWCVGIFFLPFHIIYKYILLK